MTAAPGLLGYIGQAEARVRNARRFWDPTNLQSCEQCAEQLHQAVELMLAARQAAAHGPAGAEAKLRLSRLRNEIEVLSRLVDSAMAFTRGLALRLIGEERVPSELKG